MKTLSELAKGTSVVLYARVSGNGTKPLANGSKNRQGKEGLDRQIECLTTAARQLGHSIVATISERGSGRSLRNRKGLRKALELAKQHDAALVAHDLCRLVRNSEKQAAKNQIEESISAESLNELLAEADSFGVQIATIVSTTCERELRSIQTRRGLTLSPNTKRQSGRLAWAYLYRGGMSLRAIAKRAGCVANTVRNYIRGLEQRTESSFSPVCSLRERAAFLQKGGLSLAEIARRFATTVAGLMFWLALKPNTRTNLVLFDFDEEGECSQVSEYTPPRHHSPLTLFHPFEQLAQFLLE